MPKNNIIAHPNLVADPPPNDVRNKFGGILTTLGTFRQQITVLQNQIRMLEKTVNKNIRQLARDAKKNKSKGNRKPSGFCCSKQDFKRFMSFYGETKWSGSSQN